MATADSPRPRKTPPRLPALLDMPLRLLFLTLIHAYRLLLSPLLPPSCRYTPTCSAYGLEAVRRHGALHGGWLTLRRILRCHPWGGQGYDPVPGSESPASPKADTPHTGCSHSHSPQKSDK